MSAVLDDIKIVVAVLREKLTMMVMMQTLQTHERVDRREATQTLSPNGSSPSEETGRNQTGEDLMMHEDHDDSDT